MLASNSTKFNLLKESILSSVAEEVVLKTAPSNLVLPKFELHAHINGSIPLPVLMRFAEEDWANASASAEPSSTDSEEKVGAKKLVDEIQMFMTPLGPEASPSERMSHCFKVFDVVYKLVQTRQRLREATRAVVRSFIEDGCVYVELRTTPKSFVKDGTSDDQYVACVLEAIQDELKLHNSARHASLPKIRCNLLLSINRRIPIDGAQRVIDLAILFRERQKFALENELQKFSPGDSGSGGASDSVNVASVVGIDFCGDCYARTFQEFVPAIERAKQHNFPVTIHMGEKQDDEEVFAMLSAGPSRVGHIVFISDRAAELIRIRQIPVEVCITSNMMTGGLAKPSDHHIVDWLRASRYHPVTINTDDFSVFSTTLCKEMMLFAEICVDTWIGDKQKANGGQQQLVVDAAPNVIDQPEMIKNKFYDELLHFVCCELWRVQFHAARCCFLMNESDRMILLQMLEESHEKFWKSKQWL